MDGPKRFFGSNKLQKCRWVWLPVEQLALWNKWYTPISDNWPFESNDIFLPATVNNEMVPGNSVLIVQMKTMSPWQALFYLVIHIALFWFCIEIPPESHFVALFVHISHQYTTAVSNETSAAQHCYNRTWSEWWHFAQDWVSQKPRHH